MMAKTWRSFLKRARTTPESRLKPLLISQAYAAVKGRSSTFTGLRVPEGPPFHTGAYVLT